MRYFLFLLLPQIVFCFERSNIPLFDPQAAHVLHFSIQKDFSDGSLTSCFLQELKTCFGIELFIETGTHLGNTAAKAGEIFQTVHTIELFPEFYSLARQRFEKKKNIHLHFGNSSVLLTTVLSRCSEPALFYLDGHYDGGKRSGQGEKNTPILEELRAIQAWGRTDAVIVIDDLCDFQDSLYPDRIRHSCFDGYPDLSSLIEEILSINPRYQICFIPNALLVYPPSPQVAVSPVLSACTVDRFSTTAPFFSEEELCEAEKTIAAAQNPEKMELERYGQAYSSFECEWGWRSFAAFWMGLLCLDSHPSQAQQFFQSAADHSLPGWRVERYRKRIQ